MFTKRYRLIDIARQIDRDKSTIIRWEEMGFIPSAERDSRGWRFYHEKEAKRIVELVKKTNYFRDLSSLDEGLVKARPQRMVYIGVITAVLLATALTITT